MSAATATFEELQGRNYVVLGRTLRIKSAFAQLSEHARNHAAILVGLTSIAYELHKILDILHNQPLMELLPTKEKRELADLMERSHAGNRNTIALLRSVELGLWTPLYTSPLKVLDRRTLELVAHIQALRADDCEVLALSKRDQEKLARALAEPAEPNAKLRKALDRHTISR